MIRKQLVLCYGRMFRIFEYTLDALIIVYLIGIWRRQVMENASHRTKEEK